MAELHSFPQSGDNDDAENFAQLVGHPNLVDFVITGMAFTPDYTVPDVDISTGSCAIGQASETTSSTSETRLNTAEVVQLPATTLSLTDSDVNYIYVEPNLGTDDNASFTAYTNESNASTNALKIGEVDTSADTSTTFNRAPSGSFSSDFSVEDPTDSSNTLFQITGTGPVEHFTGVDIGGDLRDSSDNVIYDDANAWINQARLENSSLTITSGDGLKNGGSVSLGGSTTLDIEPADFAGTFLSDDGTDDLTVDIGVGLENDGSGNIRVDEDVAYTFTSNITISSDLLDGSSNTVYDQSNNWVPEERVEQGPGSGLDADTLDGRQASDFADTIDTESGSYSESGTATTTTINLSRSYTQKIVSVEWTGSGSTNGAYAASVSSTSNSVDIEAYGGGGTITVYWEVIGTY